MQRCPFVRPRRCCCCSPDTLNPGITTSPLRRARKVTGNHHCIGAIDDCVQTLPLLALGRCHGAIRVGGRTLAWGFWSRFAHTTHDTTDTA